jgi:molybdopterin converting factor small subunit
MAITLHLPGILAKLAEDQLALEVDARTVGEAVETVAARYPALGQRLRDAEGRPYQFVTFYVNDEDIRLNGGFLAALRDGDDVTVVPAVAGG